MPVSDHTKTDRPRGILSKADREYLLASEDEREENYSRQARSKRERAIRERILHGVWDFTVIFEEMSDRQLEEFFNPEETELDSQLRLGMINATALFYLKTWTDKYGKSLISFDMLLQEAVWAAMQRQRGLDPEEVFEEIVLKTSVIFDIIEPALVNVENIADKINRKALYELTEEEFRFYIYVQSNTGSKVKDGEEGAKEFLENVEQLTDERDIDTDV